MKFFVLLKTQLYCCFNWSNSTTPEPTNKKSYRFYIAREVVKLPTYRLRTREMARVNDARFSSSSLRDL